MGSFQCCFLQQEHLCKLGSSLCRRTGQQSAQCTRLPFVPRCRLWVGTGEQHPGHLTPMEREQCSAPACCVVLFWFFLFSSRKEILSERHALKGRSSQPGNIQYILSWLRNQQVVQNNVDSFKYIDWWVYKQCAIV